MNYDTSLARLVGYEQNAHVGAGGYMPASSRFSAHGGLMLPVGYPIAQSPPCGTEGVSALQQAMYNMACQEQEERYQRAQRTSVAAQQPQITLGIFQAAVAAGATVPIAVSPTNGGCITRILIASQIAQFFSISSVRTGRVELLADGARIPADIFRPDACCVPLEFPYTVAGTLVTMTVINEDGALHDFRGTYLMIPGPMTGPCLG